MKIAFFVNCNNTIKIMICIIYQELLAKEKVEEGYNPFLSLCVCARVHICDKPYLNVVACMTLYVNVIIFVTCPIET